MGSQEGGGGKLTGKAASVVLRLISGLQFVFLSLEVGLPDRQTDSIWQRHRLVRITEGRTTAAGGLPRRLEEGQVTVAIGRVEVGEGPEVESVHPEVEVYIWNC